MAKIITITASEKVQVTSETIKDGGRERVPNGVDVIEKGESMDFIIHSKQALYVSEYVEPEPEPAVDYGAVGNSDEDTADTK